MPTSPPSNYGPKLPIRAITALPSVASYQDSQALNQLYHRFTGLFYTFIAAMLALGVLMAFAIIFTTMSVNILERQREMATLRIGGVPQRTVARIITGENLLLTLLGVLPGLALGVLGGQAFLATYSNDQLRLELAIRPTTLAASAAAILAVAILSQRPGLRAIARLNLANTVRERAG
jgi:putative ABC transport system permease protein